MLPLLTLMFFAAADPTPARVTPNTVAPAPVEVRAAVGSLVTLTGSTGSSWTLVEGSCGFWPDGAVCRIASVDRPGRFLVLETVAGEVKRHAIAFDGPLPMPPGPGPTPVPPGPPPVDPLKATLTAAFVADAGDAATKKADVQKLASLYGQAVSCCSDGTCTTPQEVLTKVKAAASGSEQLADRLLVTRKAAGSAVVAVLLGPLPLTTENQKAVLNAPFTDASKTAIVSVLKQAETILEGLGK